MFAGQIVDKEKLEIIDVAEPDPSSAQGITGSEGAILFQLDLACLCGSDLPFFRGQEQCYPLDPGFSLHEMIGTVAETTGKRFDKGAKVLAVPVRQQGFFERYWVSEQRAIPLDPRCHPDHALMAQPLGTVIYGLKKIPRWVGKNVAIVGQGPIGQLFCAVMRNLGAREIIALDRIESRLEVSGIMGATKTINIDRKDPVAEVARLTRDVMADVVIEVVGHADQCLNFCVDLCRQDGRILYFGVPPQTIDRVEWSALFFKNITVSTTVNPSFEEDFPLAMRWIAEGRLDVSPIITHRYPVREAQQAFELFHRQEDGALKVYLDFSR